MQRIYPSQCIVHLCLCCPKGTELLKGPSDFYIIFVFTSKRTAQIVLLIILIAGSKTTKNPFCEFHILSCRHLYTLTMVYIDMNSFQQGMYMYIYFKYCMYPFYLFSTRRIYIYIYTHTHTDFLYCD